MLQSMPFAPKPVPACKKSDQLCVEHFNWDTMNSSFSRNYPITAQQRHNFIFPLPSSFSPSYSWSQPVTQSIPLFLCSSFKRLSNRNCFPQCQTFRALTKPRIYGDFFLLHLNLCLSGNQSPQRVSIFIGHWQQAAQVCCLLLMKAKKYAARSESKTLNDRYDTKTASCFTGCLA